MVSRKTASILPIRIVAKADSIPAAVATLIDHVNIRPQVYECQTKSGATTQVLVLSLAQTQKLAMHARDTSAKCLQHAKARAGAEEARLRELLKNEKDANARLRERVSELEGENHRLNENLEKINRNIENDDKAAASGSGALASVHGHIVAHSATLTYSPNASVGGASLGKKS